MPTYATTTVRANPYAVSALSLNGKSCGLVRGVTGGAIFAGVVEQSQGPGRPLNKHLAHVEYEPFELQAGFTLDESFYRWIADTWKGEQTRMSGELFACDDQLNIKAERKFHNALLTEVTIPALDKGSQEVSFLSVKFAPEFVEFAKVSGKASGTNPNNPEKAFLPSHFELNVRGLECEKVQRIEPFTVVQKVSAESDGYSDRHLLAAGALRFPDLHVTFSDVSADSWSEWFQEFVVKGRNSDDYEKTGELTLLSPNRQPLLTIKLSGLGIYRLGALDHNVDDKHRLATASVYCESMTFERP